MRGGDKRGILFLILFLFIPIISPVTICNPSLPNGCPVDLTGSNLTLYQNITNNYPNNTSYKYYK